MEYNIDLWVDGIYVNYGDIDGVCPLDVAVYVAGVNCIDMGDIVVKNAKTGIVVARYEVLGGMLFPYRDLTEINNEMIESLEVYFNKQVMDDIINKNPGIQEVLLFEEMSELQKELCKYLRNKGSFNHLVEELAHVLICIRQICKIYNISMIDLQNEIDKKTNEYIK